MALLLVACTAPAHPDTVAVALAGFESVHLRTVVGSDEMRRYLSIPTGSEAVQRLPRERLTSLAMAESFLLDPSWSRVWHVVRLQPDEFSGVAVANYLRRADPANFVRFELEGLGAEALGVEPRIRVEPSKRVGEVSRYVADIRRAQELLDYHPQVPLDEGIRRAVAWWRSSTHDPT